MAGNESYINLIKVLSIPEEKEVKIYINVIQDEGIPITCVNKKNQKKRLMPFKSLNDIKDYFWKHESDWEYFISNEELKKINEKYEAGKQFREYKIDKSAARTAELKREIPNTKDTEEIEELEEVEGFGYEYREIAEMSTEEKVDFLSNDNNRLIGLFNHKPGEENIVTEALVDTTKDAALVNHAILEDALRLGDDEAKKITQEMVDITNDIAKSSTQLIMDDVLNNELMLSLVQKSNGTIVQHMTRVYLNAIAFVAYYNKLVSTSSAIQRLRISFAAKYRKYYHVLLPHVPLETITLEKVFYGGMRAIPLDYFQKWAVGFLLHDIGKATAVQYHEGEEAYNRNLVIEHVKQGYTYIMAKTNFPTEASLITGYHHEYYGDPEGYGYFRAYLQQYKKLNPTAKQEYCISFDKEPMLDYVALSYFPAKVLEIIDVYDSVTDPNRVYRKAMNPQEALAMMKENFLEKHVKIDPILFDLFTAFTLINLKKVEK